MKSKTFVMMFLAVGCGLVAAYMTAKITAKQTAPDTQPVLVAKEKIPAGQVIKDPEKQFVLMAYPTGSTPNAITSYDDLKNKIVAKTVQPGQWLTPDDISGNFGIDLPKGYYAMSVKVDAASAGSGFILPKSKVNVVATIKPTGLNGKPKVVTILQDVLVLAVDTMSVRPEDKIAVGNLNTVLLAVKPSDSQKLSLAQSMGELRLVLRGHDDDAKVTLPPLEGTVDADGNFSDGSSGTTVTTGPVAPNADKTPKAQVAVANQDLEPGAVIDEPNRLFRIESVAKAGDKAILADQLDDLRGKTLKHSLFKDGVVTSKHFEGDEAPVTAKVVENKHLMFIQNGGQAPQMVTFRDGVAVLPEQPKVDAPGKKGTGETN